MSIKYFTWFMKSRNKIDTVKGVDEHGDFKSKQIKDEVINGKDEIIRGLYKIFDKLEQRIATLEKVLESHAKCIGEIREEKNE